MPGERPAHCGGNPRRLVVDLQAPPGDLMFENDRHRQHYLEGLRRAGHAALADEIEDEFFWDAAQGAAELEALGFGVTVKRFSELSWGMSARRPGPPSG